MERRGMIVEFDKVIHTNSHTQPIGSIRSKIVQLLKSFALDYDIVVATFRSEEDLPEVEQWLITNGVPFNFVTTNSPLVVAYIGRRAINDKTLFQLSSIVKESKQ